MEKEYYIHIQPAGTYIGPYESQEAAQNAMQENAQLMKENEVYGEIHELYSITEKEALLHQVGLFYWLKRIIWAALCGYFVHSGITDVWKIWTDSANKDTWHQVPATLAIEYIKETKRKGLSTWEMSGEFTYQYPESGQTYTSTNMGNYDADDVKSFMVDKENYHVLHNTHCLVNPEKPEEAALFHHDRTWSMFYPYIFILLLGCSGLICTALSISKKLLLMKLNKQGKLIYHGN